MLRLYRRPTNTRSKNTFRPAMSSLEGRCMADAKMVGALIAHADSAVVARPVPVEVARLDAADQASLPVARPAAASAYHYTAITIKNRSTATITYYFEWGTGRWDRYTLAPGQQHVHYTPALNQTLTISYDKVFSPAYQEQRYKLVGNNVTFPPGFYLVQPTPSVGSGRQYTFKNVPNGVQLYS
jgi:hypothetical protein